MDDLHQKYQMSEAQRHSMCDTQSFSSLLSVVFLVINNLSGVVKDTGGVSALERGQKLPT